VYFENSSSNPYLIRRIEELNKVVELIYIIVICMLLTLWLTIFEYIILRNRGKNRDISVDLPTA